jgi:hypothetical protein
VHGFVITARCDVEQDKFPVLNYLPVVALDDWIARDGFAILQARLCAENDAAIDHTLLGCGIATSVLHSQSLEEVEKAFFSPPVPNKQMKSAGERLRRLIEAHNLLRASNSVDAGSVAQVFAINEKASASLLRELVTNRLNGYYFLPAIEDGDDDSGYVLILREVKHLPRTIAQRIAAGLDKVEASELPLGDSLCFDVDDFAMPVGELASPAVEHVLQVFANLFGRIGLRDHPSEYIDRICLRRPKVNEGLR